MNKLYLALLMLSVIVQAQQETNIWYFGWGAGVDFNSGSPVALTNSAMQSVEGVSAYADSNGNLLFYSNGEKVWDSSHQVMPNGNGLAGYVSCTQSSVFVPNPCNKDWYYLFTVGLHGTKPLSYSIINKNYNSGLGDVDSSYKNIIVAPQHLLTEKIAVVSHNNGIYYWVVSHEWKTNNFLAYLVSESGVSEPVVSSVGSIHDENVFVHNLGGAIMISPDGKKIANVVTGNGSVEVFDFDITIGVVSNPLQLPDLQGAYGISFSPDASKLYVSSNGIWTDSGYSVLWQYDLSSGDSLTIAGSGILIDSNTTRMGLHQIASDGKIYISRWDYLTIISFPDSPGLACGYVANGIYLNGKYCSSGLPVFPVEAPGDGLPPSSLMASYNYQYNCQLDTVRFFNTSAYDTALMVNFQWDFGDSLSNQFNESGLKDPVYRYNIPGNYLVRLIVENGCMTDTFEQYISTGNSSLSIYDTSVCPGSSVYIGENIYDTTAVYTWITDDALIDHAAAMQWVAPIYSMKYLFIVDATACTDSFFYSINIWDTCGNNVSFFIPNAFSPDANTINEIFQIRGTGIKKSRLVIYDRLGNKVFESQNNSEWDGHLNGSTINHSVFTYYVEIENFSENIDVYKGTIMLVK